MSGSRRATCTAAFLGGVLSPLLANGETSIHLESESGDFLGEGGVRQFTAADGSITTLLNPRRGVTVRFSGLVEWIFAFAPPLGGRLAPGPYEEAVEFSAEAPLAPAMSIDGEGRGCERVRGRFTVLEVLYRRDGSVERFAATFEHHCEGARPALRGTILVNASGPPYPPPGDRDRDGVPDVWDNCPDAANPRQADGDVDDLGDACDGEFGRTFIYFDSEASDYIGQGRRWSFYPEDGEFSAVTTTGGVRVTFREPVSGNFWGLTFQAPAGQELQLKSYDGAANNPSGGEAGISVYGDARSCDAVGSFRVHEFSLDGAGGVARLAIEFEQHCNSLAAPALRGGVFLNAEGLSVLALFRRGNANLDSRLDISDGIWILQSLFRDGPGLSCLDAADTNDDGAVNVSDAARILQYVLLGGSEPAFPSRACGADPTPDALGCEFNSPCGV